MNPACKDCRFYVHQPGDNYGACYRFPPPNREGIFPTMAEIEWCGEFQPKEVPPGFAPLDFGHMPEDMRRHIEKQKLLYGLK